MTFQPTLEPLERRTMLSTINWTNKGSPTSDTDGFTAHYGATFAETARGIVQRAVDDWERVIVNFNRTGGGTNTYNVQIRAEDLGGTTRGSTGNITYDAQGKPTSALIRMDNDAGGGGGWYFDPLVGPAFRPDDSEFTTVFTPFHASSLTIGNDFYRTVLHELGHAMGLASTSTLLQALDTDIGDDPNTTDPARLFTVNVDGLPGADFTYTSHGGFHLYEGPVVANCPIHPQELMNSGRTVSGGVRQLISDTIARFFQQAYGYTVTMPSQLNTFYVQWNDSANTITVTGDINQNGNDNDSILLRTSTSFQVFEINGTREDMSTVEFNTITINANLGNDVINLESLRGGAVTTTTVNGGGGDDTLNLTLQAGDLSEVFGPIGFFPGIGVDRVRMSDHNEARGDTYTITPTSVSRPAFNLTLNGSVEFMELTGQQQQNDFNLTADPLTDYHIDGSAGLGDILALVDTANTTGMQYTLRNGRFDRAGAAEITYSAATETVRIDAGSGNDSFTFIPGDVYPAIGINANGGNDTLLIDDRADSGTDDYYFYGNMLQKSVFGNPPGTNPTGTVWSGMESQTFHANNANNLIDVYFASPDTFIFANGGNDTLKVFDGTATVHTGSENISGVAPFGDFLGVNLDANTGEDQAGTAIISQDDTVLDLSVMSASTVGTLRVMTGAVLAKSAGTGNGFNLSGGTIDLAGGSLLVRAGALSPNLRTLITRGHNSGGWNGTNAAGAINSSLAAGGSPADALGYGPGSDLAISTIGSFIIAANDTLVRYTRYGDADLNGVVDFDDYVRTDTGALHNRTGWSNGDFNYDSVIDFDDYVLLDLGFNA